VLSRAQSARPLRVGRCGLRISCTTSYCVGIPLVRSVRERSFAVVARACVDRSTACRFVGGCAVGCVYDVVDTRRKPKTLLGHTKSHAHGPHAPLDRPRGSTKRLHRFSARFRRPRGPGGRGRRSAARRRARRGAVPMRGPAGPRAPRPRGAQGERTARERLRTCRSRCPARAPAKTVLVLKTRAREKTHRAQWQPSTKHLPFPTTERRLTQGPTSDSHGSCTLA
jgi:hypothetical protein